MPLVPHVLLYLVAPFVALVWAAAAERGRRRVSLLALVGTYIVAAIYDVGAYSECGEAECAGQDTWWIVVTALAIAVLVAMIGSALTRPDRSR